MGFKEVGAESYPMEVNCPICGNAFQATKSGHKYCSDACRAAAFREKNNQHFSKERLEKLGNTEQWMKEVLLKLESINTPKTQLDEMEEGISAIYQNLMELKELKEQSKSTLTTPLFYMINEKIKALSENVTALRLIEGEVSKIKKEVDAMKVTINKIAEEAEFNSALSVKTFYNVLHIMDKICPEKKTNSNSSFPKVKGDSE